MGNTKSLVGKIALVTGVGRSAGIGAAICRKVANHGADVFFSFWTHTTEKLILAIVMRTIRPISLPN